MRTNPFLFLRSPFLSALLLFLGTVAAPGAPLDLVQGAAVLGDNAPIIKISREGLPPAGVGEGDTLYIFTETGDLLTRMTVKNVFSDEIHSQPLEDELAMRLRAENTILIFSNLPEYGDYLKAYLDGREEAFRDFCRRHPESPLEPEGRRVADGIVYRPFKLIGTPQALDEFIRLNPDNLWRPTAEERRDQLQFEPARKADLIDQYRVFALQHPRNRFVKDALDRVRGIKDSYGRTSLPRLVENPSSFLRGRVRFTAYIHSVLPIFLEGGAVGRKTEAFKSPRSADNHINVQFDDGPYILWRAFLAKDKVSLVDFIEKGDRQEPWTVFGEVFSDSAGSPWVEILDLVPGRE